MRVSATALVLLAPVMNGLWKFAILVSVESARVDVVLDVPLFVLSDEPLDEHFVALTESLATDIVGIVTSQELLASDQIGVANDGIVFLGRVALVAVVEPSALVAKGVIFTNAVDVVSWQTTFGEEGVLSVGNAPAPVAEEVVHWWCNTINILENKVQHFLKLDESSLARVAHASDVFAIDVGNVKKTFWVLLSVQFGHFEHIVHFSGATVAMVIRASRKK